MTVVDPAPLADLLDAAGTAPAAAPGPAPATDAELDAAFLAASARYWHPVARSADVGVAPVRAVLLDVPLVLWRRPATPEHPSGQVAALVDRCPHRGVPLSDGQVDDAGLLRCPYHSWAFDAAGRCVDIPQQPGQHIPDFIAVRSVRVTEAAGLVWACLVDEAHEARPRPRFPEVEDAGWPCYVGTVQDWNGQAARQVENFCDIGHFSVLHTDTFGNGDVLAVDPYPVRRTAWTIECDYRYPSLDPVAEPGPDGRRPVGETFFRYRIELPFAVWLGNAIGPDSVLFSVCAPTSATTLRLFWVGAYDPARYGDGPVDGASLQAVEDRIWAPDKAVVESQRPARVFAAPEVHRGFDALGVAYRKALRELGFAPPARRD
ncbi:MAG: aromatic ring-hydroxylating dioxygenase subunit alpha [Frankia sp.]|nr:aromatic ring-hydroxylating dioxygenase subunit alpha [Frankia sp.]